MFGKILTLLKSDLEQIEAVVHPAGYFAKLESRRAFYYEVGISLTPEVKLQIACIPWGELDFGARQTTLELDVFDRLEERPCNSSVLNCTCVCMQLTVSE